MAAKVIGVVSADLLEKIKRDGVFQKPKVVGHIPLHLLKKRIKKYKKVRSNNQELRKPFYLPFKQLKNLRNK